MNTLCITIVHHLIHYFPFQTTYICNIYIYIYIYTYYIVMSLTLGFMLYEFVRQIEGFQYISIYIYIYIYIYIVIHRQTVSLYQNSSVYIYIYIYIYIYNQDLRYVDRGSNHPKQVFKHIPKGIEHRLSNNSNKEIFERSKQEYEEALKDGGYRIKLEYRDREGSNRQKRRNRPRKIIWFNPPYNMEVVNNLGKEFFKLLKRNFPSENPLHKIFNKNCVKLSYSCMPNINGIINKGKFPALLSPLYGTRPSV